MRRALVLARKADKCGEVPVGCVIVHAHAIIGEGFNNPIGRNDPTSHAEIIAMREAGNRLKNYRLNESTMYVTLEPCSMCMGAILSARIKKLFYGATDLKTGACGGNINLAINKQLNHHTDVYGGLMAEESGELLRSFFKKRR